MMSYKGLTCSSSNSFMFFGASWESAQMFGKPFEDLRVAHIFWFVFQLILVKGPDW